MEYPELDFRTASQMTQEEGNILYDVVIQSRARKIVEIGTFGGFATIYLAKAALKNHNILSEVVTVDHFRNLNPSANDMFVKNDVTSITKACLAGGGEDGDKTILKVLEENLESTDLLFIGELHYLTDKVWKVVKKVKRSLWVVLHCNECEPADEMKTPEVWQDILNYGTGVQNHYTKDRGGYVNGIGVAKVTFDEEPVKEEVDTETTVEKSKKESTESTEKTETVVKKSEKELTEEAVLESVANEPKEDKEDTKEEKPRRRRRRRRSKKSDKEATTE